MLCLLPAVGQEVDVPAELDIPVTSDLLVQNWQSDDGLPRNTILSIAQDRDGYLWLGTPYGVIRFDGIKFTAFEHESSLALARGSVRQVYGDREGVLWIATRRSGLLRHENGRFERVDIEVPDDVSAVDSVVQDGQGERWLTCGNGLLARIDRTSARPVSDLGGLAAGPMLWKLLTDAEGDLWFYRQDTYGQILDGRPANLVRIAENPLILAASGDGGMWIATASDLRRLAPGEFANDEVVGSHPFGPYGISALYEDRSGTLWIGTVKDGLYRWAAGRLERVDGVHHQVHDVLEDPEGNLWVGTAGGGLFRLRPRVFHVIGQPEGLSTEVVRSVCGDWVALRAAGLGRISSPTRAEMVPGYGLNSLASVLEDGAGGVWMGTAAGRLLHRTGAGRSLPAARVAAETTQLRVQFRDRRGNHWIGGFPNGLFFRPAGGREDWLPPASGGFDQTSATAITEDADGAIWVGTSSGELRRLVNGEQRVFGAEHGMPQFPVGTLLPASDGSLWVGSLGGGLGRFNGDGCRFADLDAGLEDNVISQLVEDDSGGLWIGSSRGISRVQKTQLERFFAGAVERVTSVAFGRSEGLFNIQCTAEHQPSVWKTPSGQLRFATAQGVVLVNPGDLPTNTRPPPLSLEQLVVDGTVLANRSNVELPYNCKKLEFHYTALSFVAPERIVFKRRLLGFDDDWIEDGTARVATYPRLSPGPYEFQFTACNSDGVWNEKPFVMGFQIVPAFWQTAWFRSLAVLAFAVAVAGSARYLSTLRMRRALAHLEQEHALERERGRIARDLHDDLGARLTQIALLTDLSAADLEAPSETRLHLRDASQQARGAVQSLDETVWMLNPMRDSVPHLIGYIVTYAEQFFSHSTIACRLDVCPNPPDCPLPGKVRHQVFLVVKETLTNVLRHSEAPEVHLRFAVRGPVLRIVIRDNGRGFRPGEVSAARHGLGNMQRRAEEVGVRCTVRSAPGKGTQVALRVRLTPGAAAPRAGLSTQNRQ